MCPRHIGVGSNPTSPACITKCPQKNHQRPNPMQLTKELTNLVVLAQSGEKDAFNELVTLFSPELHSVVMKRVRHTQDCEEVVQDVFLRVVRKIHQLEDPTKFSGWIHKMANNLAINKALRRPKEKETREPFALEKPYENDPLGKITQKDAGDLLHKAIEKLKKTDKDILHVFYFGGTPVKKIAKMLNVPIGTAKRRMHTARERLKNEITKITKTELRPAN